MVTDSELISVINGVTADATQTVAYEWVSRTEWPPGVKDFWTVSQPISETLAEHPEFRALSDKFYLGRQINLHHSVQGMNLLRVAVNKGPEAAIAWYRRVISTQTTTMRVVGQVFGLSIDAPHVLSNGITLLPVSALPDSPNSSILKQGLFMGPGVQFPCALVVEIPKVSIEASQDGHEQFLGIADEMRRTMNAYALADSGSPIVAETWTEFVDEDLQAAEIGRSWQVSRTEGAQPSHGVTVTPEALDWLEKYLKLPKDVSAVCNVPLARLNIADRRISAGDRALDGSICLEALLSGKSRGELTHKLAVRTALLLGKTLEERQEIAKKVRKFYEVRSAVVHGSGNKNEVQHQLAAEEGLSLCRSALRSIVEHGKVPEPEIWELIGGPSWNRLA